MATNRSLKEVLQTERERTAMETMTNMENEGNALASLSQHGSSQSPEAPTSGRYVNGVWRKRWGFGQKMDGTPLG